MQVMLPLFSPLRIFSPWSLYFIVKFRQPQPWVNEEIEAVPFYVERVTAMMTVECYWVVLQWARFLSPQLMQTLESDWYPLHQGCVPRTVKSVLHQWTSVACYLALRMGVILREGYSFLFVWRMLLALFPEHTRAGAKVTGFLMTWQMLTFWSTSCTLFDVCIHDVKWPTHHSPDLYSDASGLSDADGNKVCNYGSTDDLSHPLNDLEWVRTELVEWVYSNVFSKWDSFCQRGIKKVNCHWELCCEASNVIWRSLTRNFLSFQTACRNDF